MAGAKSFLVFALFFLFSFYVLFTALQWAEFRAAKAAYEKESRAGAVRTARLARDLLMAEGVNPVEPYPLFDFARKRGGGRMLVFSPSGALLNDTRDPALAGLHTPEWLDWPRAAQALGENGHSNITFITFTEGGVFKEAVFLPFEKDGSRYLVAFIYDSAMKGPGNYQRFLMATVMSAMLVFLAWSFLRLYQRGRGRQDEPTEVGFVVDTFQGLVAKLKEKEAELDALREKAEERALLIEISSENVLESVASGVISFDQSFRITKLNGRAAKILGISREEAAGRGAAEALSGPLIKLLEKGDTVERGETPYRTASGKDLWLGFSITPFKDREGSRIGQVLVFTDLTELKVLERQAELRKRLSSLGEISAGIAHELRNPMAVIAGYSRMLEKKAPEGLRAAAENIAREISAMDSIIKGFLSFARPVEPVPAPVDLKELLRGSLRSALAENTHTEAVFNYEGPEGVSADETLLKQAFTNIIQNAVQAMPSGGRLTVRAERGPEEAVVKISDTGHGIPEEIKEKIFLPFYTTKEGGTGLGLAIAHSIIQSHGGFISLETSPSGTTVIIRLPVKAGPLPA